MANSIYCLWQGFHDGVNSVIIIGATFKYLWHFLSLFLYLFQIELECVHLWVRDRGRHEVYFHFYYNFGANLVEKQTEMQKYSFVHDDNGQVLLGESLRKNIFTASGFQRNFVISNIYVLIQPTHTYRQQLRSTAFT